MKDGLVAKITDFDSQKPLWECDLFEVEKVLHFMCVSIKPVFNICIYVDIIHYYHYLPSFSRERENGLKPVTYFHTFKRNQHSNIHNKSINFRWTWKWSESDYCSRPSSVMDSYYNNHFIKKKIHNNNIRQLPLGHVKANNQTPIRRTNHFLNSPISITQHLKYAISKNNFWKRLSVLRYPFAYIYIKRYSLCDYKGAVT